MGKLLPIIIAMAIMLCGCSDNNQTVAVPGYTCQAQIEYDEDFSATAQINVPGGGIFEVGITSPPQLKGLNFSSDREKLTVSLEGIEIPCQLEEGYSGFAKIMSAAFLKLSTGSPTLTNQKLLKFEGTANGFFFKFILNEEGFPLSLSVPEKKLKVEFSNWQYNKKN